MYSKNSKPRRGFLFDLSLLVLACSLGGTNNNHPSLKVLKTPLLEVEDFENPPWRKRGRGEVLKL
jgi:hypothetical protein